MTRDADSSFEAIVDAFAEDKRLAHVASAWRAERVSARAKKFGSRALKVNGKMFAMMVNGQLVVKLEKSRASALVESGDGEYFDPGHGRLMKQWVVVSKKRSWIDRAREAYDFVGGRQDR